MTSRLILGKNTSLSDPKPPRIYHAVQGPLRQTDGVILCLDPSGGSAQEHQPLPMFRVIVGELEAHGAALESPERVTFSNPTASMTASMSCTRCSRSGTSTEGSDNLWPRLSKHTNLAISVSALIESRMAGIWEPIISLLIIPGTDNTSGGPLPCTV